MRLRLEFPQPAAHGSGRRAVGTGQGRRSEGVRHVVRRGRLHVGHRREPGRLARSAERTVGKHAIRNTELPGFGHPEGKADGGVARRLRGQPS